MLDYRLVLLVIAVFGIFLAGAGFVIHSTPHEINHTYPCVPLFTAGVGVGMILPIIAIEWITYFAFAKNP